MNILKEAMKYVRYWYVFLLSIAICLGAASLYIFLCTPSFKVNSTLLIKETVGAGPRIKESAFSDLDMFHSFSTVYNEIEVLRSKDLLRKVLQDLSLETRYYEKDLFKRKELYGEALPIKIFTHNLTNAAYQKKDLIIDILDDKKFALIDSSNRKVYSFNKLIREPDFEILVNKTSSFTRSSGLLYIEFQDLDGLAEAYSLSRLVIAPVVKDANTIQLSVEDVLPERGIDILTKLIETYNRENVENKSLKARSTIDFIDNRLKFLNQDLTGVAQEVENYKVQNMVTDLNSDAQVTVQNSGNYSQQLASANVQIAVIRSLEKYLQNSDIKGSLVPSTLTLDDNTLTALTNKYNDLQIEKQRLLRNVRPDNPLILGINEQLAGLKASIKESLNNVKKGLMLERSSLLSRTTKFQTDIKKVPALERGLLERNRAQSVKENLFHYLLQKREETALSLSSTVPNSQVIDRPAYQSTPVSPRTSLIYLCALMAGFIIPVCAIYANDVLNAKVQDVSDVKEIKGLRILGELSRKEKNEPVVIQKDSRTTLSELFRYIRMNLNFSNKSNDSQVLLITSGMKGEGKTFFSLNLAMSMAFIHKRVILLEFDLRKPDLLDYIGLKQELGLSDYLDSDTLDLDSIIIDSVLSPQLSVIGCGTFPKAPSELLMSYKIQILFDELRKRYDYIIVDTSPVGQVADAFSLVPFTDASIYLVRYNFTNLRQLDVLRDIVEYEKLKNIQIVFNDARKGNGNAYGYGRYRYESKKDSKRQLIS